MHSVIAGLLALIERDQTGGGRLAETVMVEAALNAAAEQVVEFGASGTVLKRDGNRGPVAAPQGVYPCTGDDEWVAIAVATDDQWLALRRCLGHPEWAMGEEFASATGRRRLHDLLDEALANWSKGLTASDAADLLESAGVPAGVVVAGRDIIDNPQLRSRGLFETEHHATTGDHEIPMMPFRFSRVDRWMRSPSPTLGQHNDEVLLEIGLDDAAIDGLRVAGIVGEGLGRP